MNAAKILQYEGIHCNLTIERPQPGVAVVRISGHDLGEFGDVASRELEKEITAHQQIELFIDARLQTYRSADRIALCAAHRRFRAALRWTGHLDGHLHRSSRIR